MAAVISLSSANKTPLSEHIGSLDNGSKSLCPCSCMISSILSDEILDPDLLTGNSILSQTQPGGLVSTTICPSPPRPSAASLHGTALRQNHAPGFLGSRGRRSTSRFTQACSRNTYLLCLYSLYFALRTRRHSILYHTHTDFHLAVRTCVVISGLRPSDKLSANAPANAPANAWTLPLLPGWPRAWSIQPCLVYTLGMILGTNPKVFPRRTYHRPGLAPHRLLEDIQAYSVHRCMSLHILQTESSCQRPTRDSAHRPCHGMSTSTRQSPRSQLRSGGRLDVLGVETEDKNAEGR